MLPVVPTSDALDTLFRVIHAERARLAAEARREGLAPEDALDCVHDAFCTFLKAAQRGDVPSAEGAARAYLITAVRNAARNKRRRHHLARPHETIDAIDRPADDDAAEALIAHAEEHVRLRACVARLCDTQRAVVTLRMLEERPGEDVAQLLGIPRGHVDVLLHRAKANLRSCMLES
jgi:RNA polymerase sigma-70 factor, ECF subfamily